MAEDTGAFPNADTGPLDDDRTSPNIPAERSWSSTNARDFYQARDYVYDNLILAGWSVTKEDVTRALNQWADEYRDETGGLPTSPGIVKDVAAPWIYAQRSALRSDLLPRTFRVETEDGPLFYRNTPELGPLPVQVAPETIGIDPDLTSQEQQFDLQNAVRITNDEGTVARETRPRRITNDEGTVELERVEGGTYEQEDDPNAGVQFGDPGSPVSPDFEVVDGRVIPRAQPADQISMYPEGYVESILNLAAINQQQPGSGRGKITFDKAQLEEYTRNLWRTWLREEPSNAAGLVDEYVGDATTFWRGEGGRLDYETWLKNKLRKTSRYSLLYSNMDPSQSEEQYLQSYLVDDFGLDPRLANEQTVRGLTTGAAPTAFRESVARSRDVMALGQGSFSRRFANLLAQLGPLQRA